MRLVRETRIVAVVVLLTTAGVLVGVQAATAQPDVGVSETGDARQTADVPGVATSDNRTGDGPGNDTTNRTAVSPAASGPTDGGLPASYFQDLKLLIPARNMVAPFGNPWHYVERVDRPVEGFEPPVWVVVFADNADFGEPLPADQPARAFTIDDGEVVPQPDGTEPTNDEYFVLKPQDDQTVVKFVAEFSGFSNGLAFGNRTLTESTDRLDPGATFVIEGEGGDVEPAADVTAVSSNVTTAEAVRIRGSVTGTEGASVEPVAYRWSFGDGTTATGQTVAHSYDEAGNYTVDLTIETATGERLRASENVTVEPTAENLTVESLTAIVGGVPVDDYTHIEGAPLNVTYTAAVSQPAETERVVFDVGPESYVDTDGSDGWQARIPGSVLSRNRTLSVTAYGTDGQRANASASIRVVQTADWFRSLSVTALPDTDPVITYQGSFPPDEQSLFSLAVPNNFSIPGNTSMPIVGNTTGGDSTVQVTVTVNVATLEATLDVRGEASYELPRSVNVTGTVTGSGTVDIEAMDVVNASAGATVDAQAEVPPTGIPSPGPIGPVPPGIVRLYPIFGATVDVDANFDDVDGRSVPFEFTNGTVRPDLYARQEIGQKLEVAELIVGFEEGVGATIPLPEASPVYGNVFGQIYARATFGPFSQRISYPAGEDTLEYEFGPLVGDPNETAATAAAASDPTWTLRDPVGERPPGTPVSASAEGGSVFVDRQRLTDNTVADTAPAIAAVDDGTQVVWSRQDADRSVLNGRELYATGSDGPRVLTNDSVADYDPAAATSGDAVLVAVQTYDRTFEASNVSGPSDIAPYSEIRILRRSGGEWTDPIALTDDADSDRAPTVAPTDDGWFVAWTADTDADPSTRADRAVEYTTVARDGTVGNITTIPDARLPEAAVGSNGTPRLAYLATGADAGNGTVTVRDGVTGETVAEYDTGSVQSLSAAEDTVVWTAVGDTGLTVAEDGERRTLAAPDGQAGVQSVDLTAGEDRLVLTFRAVAPGDNVSTAYYRSRVDGEWLTPQTVAHGGGQSLTYWQLDTAATGDGLAAVASAKDLASEQRGDVFAFDAAFAPDLNATVVDAPAAADVGENVSLTVRVANEGDVASPSTGLRVREANTTSSILNLAPGDAVTRTLSVELDESGTLTLEADPADGITEYDESNNVATVTLARPDLTVTDSTVRRQDDTLTVSATVANDGRVEAAATAVLVRNGQATAERVPVPALAPNASAEVTATFDVDELDGGVPLTVTVDPDDTVAEATETNNVLTDSVRQPDLRLQASAIGYGDVDGSATAQVLLGNAGTGVATGQVTVVRAADGSVLGTGNVSLPSSENRSVAFTTVDVPLTGVAPDESVRVTATATTADGATDRATVSDTVSTGSTLQPPTGTITVDREASTDRTLVFVAEGRDSDGSVVDYQWSLTNVTGIERQDGPVIEVYPSAEATTMTATVTIVDDSGLRQRVSRTVDTTVPAVGGVTPNDLNDDGRYEDVDGDGDGDLFDALAYYNERNSDAVSNNPGLFDFNGDGEAGTLFDALALFNEIS